MRPLIKFFLITVFILMILPPIGLVMALGLESTRQRMAQWVFRVLARIFGLHLRVTGQLSAHRPLMLVTNHCSYADILVLGMACPVSFTPKSDIRWWPVIGQCCIVSGCVFIERKASKMAVTRQRLHRSLAKGRVISLFPEGTTTDGTHMERFKSGFFSLAEQEKGLLIQPATIRYLRRDGVALTQETRKEIAWYGESTTLLPHLMRFLSARSIEAEIVFHDPLNMEGFATRKELAAACEEEVKKGLRYEV